MNTLIPAHLTDPDDIDKWLDERDTDRDRTDLVVQAEVDAAVARLSSSSHPATGPDPATLARRKFAERPFWRRWFTPAPPGYRPDTVGLGRPVTWG